MSQDLIRWLVRQPSHNGKYAMRLPSRVSRNPSLYHNPDSADRTVCKTSGADFSLNKNKELQDESEDDYGIDEIDGNGREYAFE